MICYPHGILKAEKLTEYLILSQKDSCIKINEHSPRGLATQYKDDMSEQELLSPPLNGNSSPIITLAM